MTTAGLSSCSRRKQPNYFQIVTFKKKRAFSGKMELGQLLTFPTRLTTTDIPPFPEFLEQMQHQGANGVHLVLEATVIDRERSLRFQYINVVPVYFLAEGHLDGQIMEIRPGEFFDSLVFARNEENPWTLVGKPVFSQEGSLIERLVKVYLPLCTDYHLKPAVFTCLRPHSPSRILVDYQRLL